MKKTLKNIMKFLLVICICFSNISSNILLFAKNGDLDVANNEQNNQTSQNQEFDNNVDDIDMTNDIMPINEEDAMTTDVDYEVKRNVILKATVFNNVEGYYFVSNANGEICQEGIISNTDPIQIYGKWDTIYLNVFFRPIDNCILTGATGAGQNKVYSVQKFLEGSNSGPCEKLRNNSYAMNMIRQQGYVGTLGYTISSDGTKTFGISAEHPTATATITRVGDFDKEEIVRVGEEIQLLVEIQPGNLSVSGTDIEMTNAKLLIGGKEYDFDSTTGFRQVINYVVSEEDSIRGVLYASCSATYKYTYNLNNAGTSQAVTTIANVNGQTEYQVVVIGQKAKVAYVVGYNANGLDSSRFPSAITKSMIHDQDSQPGDEFTVLTYPSVEVEDLRNNGRWVFDGWYIDNDSTNHKYYGDTYTIHSEEDTIIFKGVWTFITESKVVYHANNGSETIYEELGALGQQKTLRDKMNFTYNRHEFVGWNTRADGSGTDYNPGDVLTLEQGTVDLYAKWIRDTLVIDVYCSNKNVYYDGTDKEVRGFNWEIVDVDNQLGLDQSRFTVKWLNAYNQENADRITRTNVGSYDFDLALSGFKLTDTQSQYKKLEIRVYKKGVLTISKAPLVVTINVNSNNVVYNGSQQQVAGFEIGSVEKANSDVSNLAVNNFVRNSISYNGVDSVTATNVGNYPLVLDKNSFVCSDSNYEISYVVNNGGLDITPVKEEITVIVVENSNSVDYNGQSQSLSGYTLRLPDKFKNIIKENDIEFIGSLDDVKATGTNVGIYELNYTKNMFVNSDNFTNINFEIEDHSLTINPATITVGIVGNKDTFKYDTKQHSVNFDFDIVLDSKWQTLYSKNDVSYNGIINDITEINADKYFMNIDINDFVNTNSNFNVTFELAEDGYLDIKKDDQEIVVTVTANSSTVTYDGDIKRVSGYTISSNKAIYDVTRYVNMPAQDSIYAEGTTVGLYPTNINEEIKALFENNNQNFSNVSFVFVNGTLDVESEDSLIVYVKADSNKNAVYNGNEYSISGLLGAEFSTNKNDVTYRLGTDFTYSEDVKNVVSAINAGTYYLDLNGTFTNLNDNYSNVKFVVERGELVISPATKLDVYVDVNSIEGSIVYDGNYHLLEGFTIRDNTISNNDYHYLSENVSISEKDAGTYHLTLDDSKFEVVNDTLKNNYQVINFIVTNGSMTIVPYSEEIIVEVNTEKVEKTYTGIQQTASGYSVSISNPLLKQEDIFFNDPSNLHLAKGINVNEIGYEYNYTKEMFSTNGNFSNVSFVINDENKLIIKPREVVVSVVGNNLITEYNGNNQTINGYHLTIPTAWSSYLLQQNISYVNENHLIINETESGYYSMGLVENNFVNNNPNFMVSFNVVDGYLNITPITNEVIVTIKANSNVEKYNGSLITAKGYQFVSATSNLYKDNFINGPSQEVVTAKAQNAGTYPTNLDKALFTNNNVNFINVKFVIVQDNLVIQKADNLIVSIVGYSDELTADGKSHTVQGYKVVAAHNDVVGRTPVEVTYNDCSYGGNTTITKSNAGRYYMELDESLFELTNSTIRNNFENVTFDVEDGYLFINEVANIDVQIIGHHTSVLYNGRLQIIRGYDVIIPDEYLDVLTVDDITCSIDAQASGKNASEQQYMMGLSEDSFSYINPNVKNITFDVEDGYLLIKPYNKPIIVTIEANSKLDSEYNGNEQTLSGYQIIDIDNESYTTLDFTAPAQNFVLASGTTIGNYPTNLQPNSFVNINTNFNNIQFNIIQGSLDIVMIENVDVNIIGNKNVTTYDGTIKISEGYEVIIDEKYKDILLESDIICNRDAIVSEVNASEKAYAMGLDKKDFSFDNECIKNVTFEVEDGSLLINPISEKVVVNVIVNNKLNSSYTSKEQTLSGYRIEFENSLYSEDYVSGPNQEEVLVSAVDAGNYYSELNKDLFTNISTNFNNVEFIIQQGELEIVPVDGIEVVIKANSESYYYDTFEKVLSGYTIESCSVDLYTLDDFIYNGNPSISFTTPGVYTLSFDESLFENISKNFTNVTFTTIDGLLTIEENGPVVVEIICNSAKYEYDGEIKELTGYSTNISNSAYSLNDFIYNGQPVKIMESEVGEYVLTYDVSKFENTNLGFTNVTFIVKDGKLTIIEKTIETPVNPGTNNPPISGPSKPVEENKDKTWIETIIDGLVALASARVSWSILSLIAVIVTALYTVIMFIEKLFIKKKNNEEGFKVKLLFVILSTILTVLAIALFILFNDISKTPVLINKMTIVFVIIAVVNVVFYLHRKEKVETLK